MNNTKSKKIDNRTEKRKIGDQGEEIVCKYLVNKGFTIIERNYLKKYGEIDIIGLKQGTYHFFEVKTVTKHVTHGTNLKIPYKNSHKDDIYRPEDNVHAKKLKRLSRVIEAYILEKKIYSKEWQFNVATVTLNMQTRLAHVEVIYNVVL